MYEEGMGTGGIRLETTKGATNVDMHVAGEK